MKKSAFFTFCFTAIPGASHMYQQYMKRGLSIMLLFSAFVLLTGITGTPIFGIPAAIIWVYSFFDTFNIRNSIGTENQTPDEYIWKNSDLDGSFNNIFAKKSYLIGIGLVLIGIYMLLDNVFYSVARNYNIVWLETLMGYITHYLPSIIIASLSIGIGVKLMFNKKEDK